MSTFNESILIRLEQLERNRSWLARKTGMAKASIYEGLKQDRNWSLDAAERIASVLGLTIDEMTRGSWKDEV